MSGISKWFDQQSACSAGIIQEEWPSMLLNV
jgi:hypothetical protein